MAGYATPNWNNDAAPAIDAGALTALGEAAEIAEHPYGVCSTAAGTAAKTVTIDFSGTLTLFTGLAVRVKFTYANTASNPTLNVNGTGAKSIMSFGTTNVPTDAWSAGEVVSMTYDGTYWMLNKKTSSDLQSIDDTSIYSFRNTPTGAETTEVLTELTGASVGWNQIVEHGNFDVLTGWIQYNASSISASDGVASFQAIASSGQIYRQFVTVEGHKYFITADIKKDSAGLVSLRSGASIKSFSATTAFQTFSFVFSSGANVTQGIGIVDSSPTSGVKTYARNVQLIDLTLMLGSTVADYVYTLESGTAGAGVAWLKEHGFIDGAYRDYDAGSIQSVTVTSHDTVGFNLWDELQLLNAANWGKRGDYYSGTAGTLIAYTNTHPFFRNSFGYTGRIYLRWHGLTSANNAKFRVHYTDGTSEYIAQLSTTEKTAQGATDANKVVDYIDFDYSSNSTLYIKDMCVSFYDEDLNGQYEPYNPHSYPLDPSLQLRGVPQLGTGNVLYYDGDTYRCDGRVVRKYGIVDLGGLSWTYSNSHFYANMPSDAKLTFSNGNKGVCGKYTVYQVAASTFNTLDKAAIIGSSNMSGTNRIFVNDSAYTDAATFKTAMSGVYLVYELDTPTIEQADSFTSNQSIDPDGTESFVGGLVPPQAEARFPTGYAAKVAGLLMPISAEMRPVDTVPTANSQNLVTSDGVKIAMQNLLQTNFPSSQALPYTATAQGLGMLTVSANTSSGGTYMLRDDTISGVVASCSAKANGYGIAWFYMMKGHTYSMHSSSDPYYSASIRSFPFSP